MKRSRTVHMEQLEPREYFAAAPQLSAAQVFAIIQAASRVSLDSQTIVVVDRNGDVLGMYGQDPTTNAAGISGDPSAIASDDTATTVTGSPLGASALIEAENPDTSAKYALLQATARARTAAFFESTQDSFTSRTARFIVNDEFPPGIYNTEAGPLLGVEFSNALGTDALPTGITTGLAAGLSGDPGGIPLFIDGQPVGAIGVAGDGKDLAPRSDLAPTKTAASTAANDPSFDSDPSGAFYTGAEEFDFDESVALAGAVGFMAPAFTQATNIFVNGLRLPFVAEGPAAAAPPGSTMELTGAGATGLQPWIVGGVHTLPARVFFAYQPLIGSAAYQGLLGTVADGLTALGAGQATAPTPPGGATIAAFQAGDTIGGIALTSVYPEVNLKLSTGKTMEVFLNNNSPAAGGYGVDAGVTPGTGVIPTTVTAGAVTATAPQAFGLLPGAVNGGQSLSISDVLTVLTHALNEALVTRAAIRDPFDVPMQVYVAVTDTQGNILAVASNTDATDFSFDVAVQKARTAAFFSTAAAAFTSRSVGFLADGEFPPALRDGDTGPLYELQESLALPQNQALFNPDTAGSNPLANGITVFPGGDPLYKNGVLVGGVGISGDGVDQDNLVAAAGAIGFEPPANIRVDALGSSAVVAAITTAVNNVANIAGDVFLNIGNSTTAGLTLFSLGFDDPDDPNRDRLNLLVNNTGAPITEGAETIISRILKRLTARGVDGVNLPFDKFPRNPSV